MDTRNNHLVRDLEEVPEERRGRYTAVPQHLEAAALAALAGAAAVKVPRGKKGGALAAWAKDERENRGRHRGNATRKAKARSKKRRKMEKATRRAQR